MLYNSKRFKKIVQPSSCVVWWVKDPALPQLWHRSQLQYGFHPWPGNFHMSQMRRKKERQKDRKKDRKTERQTDRKKDRQKDRQTDRQTERKEFLSWLSGNKLD